MQGTATLTEWDGLKPGDPVKVEGMRDKFVFRSVRVDGETPLWVTLDHSKESNKRGTRMVTPERIIR